MYRFIRCDDIVDGTDGWLDPLGNFYPCKTTEHDESARFLVSNLPNIMTFVKLVIESQYIYENWKKLNDREKLVYIGFVLINGPILRTENAANFTKPQLEAIVNSGIIVRSAYDMSVDYSSVEILAKLNEVQDMLADNLELDQLKKDLEKELFSSWYKGFLEETISSLDRFKGRPLSTVIKIFECFDANKPKKHLVLSSSIFDTLSIGFDDEMLLLDSRFDFKYRVISFGDYYLLAEWCMYTHDGLSGGSMGDYNNYLSIKVVDSKSFAENLKIIFDRNKKYYKDYPIKVVLSHMGTFFDQVISEIVT